MSMSFSGDEPRLFAHVALYGQTAGDPAVEAGGEARAGPLNCATFPLDQIHFPDPCGECWASLPICYLRTYHTHANKYTPCNQPTGKQ